jgi:hypothetical protein
MHLQVNRPQQVRVDSLVVIEVVLHVTVTCNPFLFRGTRTCTLWPHVHRP